MLHHPNLLRPLKLVCDGDGDSAVAATYWPLLSGITVGEAGQDHMWLDLLSQMFSLIAYCQKMQHPLWDPWQAKISYGAVAHVGIS